MCFDFLIILFCRALASTLTRQHTRSSPSSALPPWHTERRKRRHNYIWFLTPRKKEKEEEPEDPKVDSTMTLCAHKKDIIIYRDYLIFNTQSTTKAIWGRMQKKKKKKKKRDKNRRKRVRRRRRRRSYGLIHPFDLLPAFERSKKTKKKKKMQKLWTDTSFWFTT